MNQLIVALGLVLVIGTLSTEAIKCIQCTNCPYSQVVGMSPSDCGGSGQYCTVTEESGLYNRGCAASCALGNGYIDNNVEGLVQCCNTDGCNSAPRIVGASLPLVALLAGLFAFLRL
jgi:hypothetical protein